MKSFLLSFILFFPILCFSQYCLPTNGSPAIAPIISRVSLETIDNSTGFSQNDYGHTDYTNQSAELTAGQEYTITIETGDFFPHNIGVWIDFDRNINFSEAELIGLFVIGANNGMSKQITFQVPDDAANGITKMRVRAMVEPFGPWNLSMDPCLPSHDEGETEDYSIEINGGINGSVMVSKWISPISKIGLSEENISVEIKNIGSVDAENITAHFKLNGNVIFSENISEVLPADGAIEFTFLEKYNFSNINCENISVEIEWPSDENQNDNKLEKNICRLFPLSGENIWYLHSDIDGGGEPLSGDPFHSTTNEVSMNTVFGEGNWQQGFFETSAMDEVFSDSTCVVFLDGSYNHNVGLENLLTDQQLKIENWVAAGGKLFINYAAELGQNFYAPIGFDNTVFTFYSVGSARTQIGHPLLDGPYQPMANEYGGFYFANAVVVGEGLSTIVYETNEDGQFNAPSLHLPVLAEKSWGAGKVIFGGLSASEFTSPMQESMNLRANVLAYLHDCEFISSISEKLTNINLQLFPNPVVDELYFNNDLIKEGKTKLTVYSSTGQVVLIVERKNINQLNVSNLFSGLYFIELTNNSEKYVGKFLKK